ncbi:acyltransferase family protein [Litorihabitans aurantiacus]|uniref:acyltransferase family protein n=1 Tax=Litorihabitans aurantiacus TaxID=1930061 RepID=UPI0024E075C5|nr:acyltransferase family protein [Litorihabitans aurantiacus]
MNTITTPTSTPAPGRSATTRWRTDLEGLRVVAILLVAGYHVWGDRVSGGVDVFLMLSGFLVGGGLWRGFARGDGVRLRTYLVKHARRLLPASVTVLLVTLAAVTVILPVTRWRAGAEQTLASLLYVENWWLATTGQEYGSANPDQSPWQHFWSLSVQGQLFVAVPLLMLLTWWCVRRLAPSRRLRILALVVALTTLASFVFALVLTAIDQPVAYVHTLARAWEFLLGMVLAMALTRWNPRGPALQVLGWVGLAALLLTGLLVDGGSTFPGPATLLPVGAAVAVVVAGAASPRSALPRMLGVRPLAYAGRYAYAFYLWHWPVLVLTVAVRERSVGWLAGACVLLLSAVLAVLTHHLVEEPLRTGASVRDSVPARWRRLLADRRPGGARRALPPRPSPVARRATAISAAVLVLALPLTWLARVEVLRSEIDLTQLADVDTYPGALSVTEPEVFAEFPDVPFIPAVEAIPDTQVFADGCVTGEGDATLRQCAYGDLTSPTTVALVGGSHSEQWFAAMVRVAEALGMRLVPYLKVGCPFMASSQAPTSDCARWLDDLTDELLATGPEYIVTTSTRPAGDGEDYVPPAYLEAFDAIPTSSHIVAIRDTPWFDFSMSDCVASVTDTAMCDVLLYDRISVEDPTLDLYPDGVEFVDMNDVICPQGLCSAVQGNRLVFSDDNHMTAVYVETLSYELERRFSVAMALRQDGG